MAEEEHDTVGDVYGTRFRDTQSGRKHHSLERPSFRQNATVYLPSGNLLRPDIYIGRPSKIRKPASFSRRSTLLVGFEVTSNNAANDFGKKMLEYAKTDINEYIIVHGKRKCNSFLQLFSY